MYDKFVAKVNNVDTSRFVLKTTYDIDKPNLKKKISNADKRIFDIGWLVKKLDDMAKITEREGKILSINGLSTTSALTAVKNKIPDVSIAV